jgi:outer membrane receptor protein involved in Fe transport
VRILAWAALVCWLKPVSLAAQGVTGAAIQGWVTGPDSTAVENASVLVTNSSNGERWQTATGAKGRYYLEQLSVGGPYLIEVRAIAFAPARRTGVVLALGQRLTANFLLEPTVLQLGPITVHAAADPLINSGRTGPAQSIPESTMARLPVSGRDFSQLALLSPQVVLSRNGGLSIAGQPDRLNALQIDGATNNDLLGGSLLGGVGTPGQNLGARTLSVEAIKELQIISAPFDVRFGNFAAGLVNAITKSGTNRFEGSISGYFSDRGLVGKDPAGGRGADFENKELGATVGGPIIRDRAAYFLDVGIQRQVFPEDSPLIGTDTTGGADSVGVGIRYASAIRFRDILRNTYAVEPGGPGAFPFRVPAGNVFGKVTLQLGVNSRLEISHNYSHSFPRIVKSRKDFQTYTLTSSVFALPVTTNATRVTWTTGFGGRYTNELVAARLREADSCSPASVFPTILVHADAGTLEAGGLCMPTIINNREPQNQNILELTDNLTLASGTHRLTLGTHGELIRLGNLPFLDYFFGTGWAFSSLDSLEQGLPEAYGATLRGSARPSGPLSDPHVKQLGAYLQDQWNPNPRLTLTAGLRLDVPFLSRQPVLNQALLSSELALDNTRTPSGHILWSPRLGFNYDLAGDGTTFLRGGIGLFAGRPAYKWFVAVDAHTGLEAVHLLCTENDVPAFTIDPANQPTTCAGGDLSSPPLVNVFDPAFRFPRNLKIAIGADHRLPWGIVGTIDLLYTRATDQYDLVDLNLRPPAAVAAGEGNRLMYGTVDSFGVATPSRRSDEFGPVIQVRNTRGNRAFSITAQLQKRFTNGTEIGASYTYGRSRDRLSASEDATDGDVNLTALDGSLDRRRLTTSSWEVPHRVTLLATANLPLGFRGSLFYEGRSGPSFTYGIVGDDQHLVGDVNADGFFDDDIVYVPKDASPAGDVSLVVPDESGVLVPAPAAEYDRLERFIVGERCLREQRGRIMRRNSCRSPWGNNTQARLSRLFPTFGGHSLELTLDVFNLLHLLDKDWGVVRGSDDRLLELKGFDPANGRGVYRLLDPHRRFIDQDGSRWKMQLGARWTF